MELQNIFAGLGKGDRFASRAFPAAAKEFPFNERINTRGSPEGKKPQRNTKYVVPSSAIPVVFTTIIDECTGYVG